MKKQLDKLFEMYYVTPTLLFAPTDRCGRREVMGKAARIAAVLAIVFGAASGALSQTKPGSLPGPSVRTVAVSDIAIPPELGYVIETHQPSGSGASVPATIVHIQEAHTNYEAQAHIIKILEGLIEAHGLKLILVEGGEGDVGLEYLRAYGPSENRKEVAEKYLKTGVLSAEEYLDIVSDHPLILWGVEQKALYEQNVEAFVAAEPLQRSLQPILASVREAAESLTPHLLDPRLSDLEAKAKSFEEQTLGLAEYAEALERAANEQGILLDEAPHLARFLEARRLERTIQLPRIKEEQQALIGRLARLAPERKLEELVAKGQGMKAGTVKAAEFYAALQELASASRVDLETYPNLSDYIRYVTHSAEIKPTVLSDELDAFAAKLRTALLSTPESRQLTAIVEEVDLIEKLLDFRLSPEEYQRLRTLDLGNLWMTWTNFLTPQLDRAGLPIRSFQRLDELSAALPRLQRFYDAAQQRDELLVQNALAKLKETGEPLAVLITGGFHSPAITRMLKARGGVGILVLAPKVTTPTNERLYRAIVKYKSGRGSFDDVLAVANASATPSVSPQ